MLTNVVTIVPAHVNIFKLMRLFYQIILWLSSVCAFAGADTDYKTLREGVPSDAFRVENIALKRDVGVITLRSGQIVFLPAVANRVALAVFVGDGRFEMKPVIPAEQQFLNKITGKPAMDESFESAVFYFTDSTSDEIKKQAASMAAEPKTAEVLKNLRSRLHRDMTIGDIGNVEAELLGELYNTNRQGSFRAYLHGKHYNDLRYFVVPSGALPDLQSPEEVGLENIDPTGDNTAILYLSHFESEWKNQTANSLEDKREVEAKHYKIDTSIAKGGAISATTEMQFVGVASSAKILRIGLLAALRVKKVTDDKGREVGFIQEGTKADNSFHVLLPEPIEKGKTYTLRFEYDGNKVIRSEGSGNFSVGAREMWYPNVNTFQDHATYDLKFHVPKQFTLVSVGSKIGETKEEGDIVTEWKSDVPIAIAGFNYGEFKSKSVDDAQSNYKIEVYTNRVAPDFLHGIPNAESISPSSMAESALVDGENAIRLFQKLYGKAPYGRLAITQQPAFNFGQSWPTLVYLPVSAFLDSTQRWTLLGGSAFKFANFIQEVTPHEIAHQWFGHMVGHATYHDQWLDEGFAEFSAGVFMEATEKPDQVQKFWDRLREEITKKNNFGNSPNDAGPIWLGIRLESHKTAGAYSLLAYPKGAYILQMLRMLMREEKTGDQDFFAMMRDYIQTHQYHNASSESFMAIVQKHMKPSMDIVGNHSMAWFLFQWIYGTDIPRYKLEYSFTAGDGGKVKMTGKLTQSEVASGFAMRVPIYFDFDGHVVRGGSLVVRGSTTAEFDIALPKKPRRVMLNVNHDVLTAEAVVKEM